MKNITLSVLALTAFATMSFTFNGPLPIGSIMPKSDTKMKDISGKDITMKEAKKRKRCVGNVQLQYLPLCN